MFIEIIIASIIVIWAIYIFYKSFIKKYRGDCSGCNCADRSSHCQQTKNQQDQRHKEFLSKMFKN